MSSRIASIGWMATALFVLAGCEREAVVDTAAIEDEIRRGGRDMATAYNSGDIDTVVAKFAPDAVFMPPQSEATRGSDAVRRLWTEGSEALRKAGMAVVIEDGDTVNATADMGWLSGKYHFTNASGPDEPGGYYLQVWENRDGKWLIVRMIWTEIQPPAAAPAAEKPAEAPAT
jgi:ketosteroid isomerase-like protein